MGIKNTLDKKIFVLTMVKISKIILMISDMDESMKKDAIGKIKEAMVMFKLQTDIAKYIKTQFDKHYNQFWHCIVGKNFGSFVTHELKSFIYMYIDKLAILLFKAGKN